MNLPIERRPSERPRAMRARLAPSVASTAIAFPRHRYTQAELADAAQRVLPEGMLRDGALQRFFARVGVESRCLALPAEQYGSLHGLKERNDAWLSAAMDLAEEVVQRALDEAGLRASDVSLLATTTVTGIAVPSIDARLMNRLPFDPSLKRLPLFGLGCLGGAAGLARVAEYLRAYPEEAAMLVSVELCSLTFQLDDISVANLVSTGLFGDGAAAVLLVGAHHPLADRAPRPTVLASRSAFFPDTERVMGWDVVDAGFKVVLSPDVPKVVAEHVRPAMDGFLEEYGLSRRDVERWVMHPGGPKVIDALEESLELAPAALEPTRRSLAEVGNLSSASVLCLLDEHRRAAPEPGSHGVLMAMGPAFCAEMVLLRW
ncbi:Isopalmitoylresorcinol synthase [Sandaracinus amylolyticus]|nr:Isopalmitoylresorcinol synthase [Sandaracinus amylolyticus]